jgi:hypothetical protein
LVVVVAAAAALARPSRPTESSQVEHLELNELTGGGRLVEVAAAGRQFESIKAHERFKAHEI